ncbi:hypothetical protein MHD_00130 [Mannheimia granulomatis]|uniref:UPF0352 protein A4G16_03950 n=1 Tax=Mannheimia granulomatis TaxID=85402 RepID=A0A011MH72_9PAST|nr:DUF1414 domain-containing protein [Mannheimia granulomatis]EXI61841.1 hypothetical protein AK33_06855 [Mannheimia granulomatis]QIM67833.1 hypothetical protein A4G16_03950 [Mannheimia granulomatis]RGE49249.1 hypothetical protein MHD_00130 [Mannheimia granulomatis]
MATKSKYHTQQFDSLLADLIVTIEKHKAPVDLSLMALGNMVTNILSENISNPAQREALADAFSNALKQSLKTK